MANWAENKSYDSMMKEVKYLEGILNSLKPSSIRQNCDWSEVVKEQEAVLNTLRGDFAVRLTDLEQRLKKNTIRIFGLEEMPGEDTESVVLGYLKGTLNAWVTEHDIDLCYRAGSKERYRSRPIVVKFANDLARKRVWRQKEKVNDSVYIAQELCHERNKVRCIAMEAFGQDCVSVVDGVIQVRMNDGNEMKFYTISQISDFLKQDSQGVSGDKCKKE